MNGSQKDTSHPLGRIAIAGDLLLDQYSECEDGYSDNEQVDLWNIYSTRYFPGNAANVGNNVCSLGAAGQVLGVIGTDYEGDLLLANLHPKLDTSAVARTPLRGTTLKTRLQQQSATRLRIDREDRSPLDPDVKQTLAKMWRSLAPGVNGFILSDLGKGLFDAELIQTFITTARSCGIPVYIDPSGNDPGRYRGATAIFPNLNEFNQLTSSSFGSAVDAIMAARKLMDEYDIQMLVLKDAGRGCCLIEADRCYCLPALCRNPLSVVGAGDSLIAAFAVYASIGASSADALLAGALAAGVAVSKPFTATVTPEDIAALSQQRHIQNLIFTRRGGDKEWTYSAQS
ncbi:hypothetical protein DNH61_06385 [Paenibacillus sambharensis]|uniref:Carbohydrate kinase PfkB domain-containing protein n=1 Tax=Paenibacillus sambharensis TaxID=1803190 RepID=A0A2W1LYR9_9BACL|nr:PfkB family carbohydrate kinase [Paenibacillus sambharensis]PZD96821.1 hypothetical protein DNH61_06385 [Paenibacillus sambharensis]